MSAKKTMLRGTKKQISFLCQYMAENVGFASGEYRSAQGASSINREWAKLKEALDQIGSEKSIEQWKICWRDQKRKARAEGGAANKARSQTGNNVPIPPISENASLILGTIGNEMAVGLGPEESPIGDELVGEVRKVGSTLANLLEKMQ